MYFFPTLFRTCRGLRHVLGHFPYTLLWSKFYFFANNNYERRERQEYTNLRNKLIFVVQNKRIPVDILQECLFKMDPFMETSSTFR